LTQLSVLYYYGSSLLNTITLKLQKRDNVHFKCTLTNFILATDKEMR